MYNKYVTYRLLQRFFFFTTMFLLRSSSPAQQTGNSDIYKSLTLFSDAFNQVRSNYIEDVRPAKLVESAIVGLLSSLDPHSTYLDSGQFRLFQSLSEGTTIDVGIELEIINGYPFIISFIDGSPGAKSTLVPGDMLVKINETFTYDYSEPQLKLMLMGEKGSEVRLTIRKPITNEEKVVTLTRKDIPVKTISFATMIDPTIGYVKISRFGIKTSEEYQSAVSELRRKGMKHLILDLRGNPGGVMKSALEILDMYVPEGEMIARIAARKAVANETTYASNKRKQPMYSMTVLINQSSASASELVAGTLQDLDRALIVGNNSFGKGLVQSTFLLSNHGAILMTMGKYYTASGRCLQRTYEGKRPQDYYMEVFVADSLAPSGNLKFATKNGRTIFGGSGVCPDVRVHSEQLNLLRKLDRSGVAVQWAASHRASSVVEFTTFEKFQQIFKVTDEMINNFIGTYKSYQIDTNLIKQNIDFIRVLLKSEIASLQWGKKESLLISKNIDPIILEAIASVPKAEELLVMAKKN